MTYRFRLLFVAISTLCFGIAAAFTPMSAKAQTPEEEARHGMSLTKCTPSPAIGSARFYPGEHHIVKSNNLRRITGEAEMAEGIPLVVTGQLLDSACRPVMGAHIELWQANHYGRYHSAKSGATIDPYFAGSGMTRSDNLGYFRFQTIFPGYPRGGRPSLHVKIRHKDHPTLTTQLYFSGEEAKRDTDSWRRLDRSGRDAVTAWLEWLNPDKEIDGYKADYTLILKQPSPFKHY